jgi:hypothetical protein
MTTMRHGPVSKVLKMKRDSRVFVEERARSEMANARTNKSLVVLSGKGGTIKKIPMGKRTTREEQFKQDAKPKAYKNNIRIISGADDMNTTQIRHKIKKNRGYL